MIVKKEKTAPNVSVGADTEQSIQKCTDISINDILMTLSNRQPPCSSGW